MTNKFQSYVDNIQESNRTKLSSSPFNRNIFHIRHINSEKIIKVKGAIYE